MLKFSDVYSSRWSLIDLRIWLLAGMDHRAKVDGQHDTVVFWLSGDLVAASGIV